MMKKIDVHADDYGLTMQTSRDIMEGIKAKKLNSISIMPNTTCFEAARDFFFENLNREHMPLCSVHLNFMEGYCVADKEELSYLVDKEGLFIISWGKLVEYNYIPKVRDKVKKQLKTEIKAQIEKTVRAYGLLEQGKKLRVDSHQHTHMIPLVMEALLEVVEEERYPTEYIRISREPWTVYIKQLKLLPTYRVINLIKVMVLNWYSRRDEKLLKKKGLPSMLLSGVFLSGKMDGERVKILLPGLEKYAQKKGLSLEVLFHPGSALEEEIGKEFNHPDANEFYLSENRKTEYKAMMDLSY